MTRFGAECDCSLPDPIIFGMGQPSFTAVDFKSFSLLFLKKNNQQFLYRKSDMQALHLSERRTTAHSLLTINSDLVQ